MKEVTVSGPQLLLLLSARNQEHVQGKCLVLLSEHPLSAAAPSRGKILEEMTVWAHPARMVCFSLTAVTCRAACSG